MNDFEIQSREYEYEVIRVNNFICNVRHSMFNVRSDGVDQLSPIILDGGNATSAYFDNVEGGPSTVIIDAGV